MHFRDLIPRLFNHEGGLQVENFLAHLGVGIATIGGFLSNSFAGAASLLEFRDTGSYCADARLLEFSKTRGLAFHEDSEDSLADWERESFTAFTSSCNS